MEITINTESKTIKIKEKVNISDFLNFIAELLGDNWKEYNFEIEKEYIFSQPTVYPIYPSTYPSIYPPSPFDPIIYCSAKDGTGVLDNVKTY